MADADTLLDAWLAAELDDHPVLATELGAPGRDDRLGDHSAEAFERRATEDRRWAGRFDQLSLPEEPLDSRVDVTVVLSHLAARAVRLEWQAWRRDPAEYLDPCLDGVFALFLHRLRPEPELAAAAVARLREVPGVLAAARANLDPELAPRLLVDRGLRAARGGVTYLRHVLPAEVGDDGLRRQVASAADRAAEALEDFAAVLAGLADRCRGDWRIGEARYDRLLQDRELLAYGATELHARGLTAWADLDAEATALAQLIEPATDGWSTVVADLAADHPATADIMRDGYEMACADARRFLVERELVTFAEGEECRVVPSPVHQRATLAVASYFAPPPFSSSRVGHFNVAYPPDDASPGEVEERLADNAWFVIPTTSVHEAYPGHHWHLSWSASCPRPVRKVLTTPYFVEGWALYAERMMYEQGFFTTPAAALGHVRDRIFRAARVVVDPALHSGDMTVDAAVEHMTTKGGLPPAVARAEVERYGAWPTQAASYLTGALEIQRMRDRWSAEGRGDLRSFHDGIAASPGLPLGLAELATFGP
jgi:hypothetical protein